MRALGAPYTAAQAESVARPVWRVIMSGHGGATDPLDITPWIDSCDVQRPLRGGNQATITLHNEAGQFDPISGVYADAVRAANAVCTIEMGERLAGVPTFWTVLTGAIHTNGPRYDGAEGIVELEILDRARNPWQHVVTSPLYEATGLTPVYYTAHAIIRDLFERFEGFTWPGDFNLDPAGDWTLYGPAQFSQEAVGVAAAKCLQPSGYRLWFDYDGTLTSALLIPAGAPGTWPVLLTLTNTNIGDIDGPTDTEPTATRIRVIGGEAAEEMVTIADHSVMATTHFTFAKDGVNYTLYEKNGDVYYVVWVGVYFHPHLWFQGAEEVDWRDLCSAVGPIRYNIGDDTANTWFSNPEVIWADPASDVYHAGMERHVVEVSLHVRSLFPIPAEIDCEIDILGHRTELIHPIIYTQEWDDALITIWGDTSMSVENPLVQRWGQGATIGEQEMAIAGLSINPATVTLARLDLRVEPGDVLTIENSHGADFKLWVRALSHGCAAKAARTTIQGYVIA